MDQKPTKVADKKAVNRVRTTKRSLEAKQFSSIPMPKSDEVQGANAHIHEKVQPGSTFDPIPNDPMFTVVTNSKYWPPPPLADLGTLEGENLAGGMDLYDRRADEAAAKKAKVARVEGELNHPRGKTAKNVKVSFDE